MKILYKIAGKKFEAEESGKSASWSFEERPGGWVVARRAASDGSVERVRFHHLRRRGAIFAKFATPRAHDLFGERIEVSAGGHSAKSVSDYTAQFPGKVRKISVREGDVVTAGTPLLMVEAMKMEFAIKAGTDGKVVRLLVQEGMQLSPGQTLLDFEEKV